MANATILIATIAVTTIATGALLSVATSSGGGETPGTAVEPRVNVRPAAVSGTFDRVFTIDERIEPYVWPDGTTSEGRHQGGATFATDDDRLSGIAASTFHNLLPGGPLAAGVFWGTLRIENELGAWVGSMTGAGIPVRTFDVSSTLVGEGGYEGLFAVIHMSAERQGPATIRGVILPGEPPPTD